MTENPAQMFDVYVIYAAKEGVRKAIALLPAPTRHEAIKAAQAQYGIVEVVRVVDAGVEDVIRLTLPTLMMLQLNIQNLTAIIAQDAAERTTERAKGKLNLVRGG